MCVQGEQLKYTVLKTPGADQAIGLAIWDKDR